MTAQAVPVLEHCNEVRLVGRVSGDPVLTRLPSGDFVATVRLVVERPRPPAGRGTRRRVDALTCAAWSADVQRTVMRWCADDIVEVNGSLHRRFWRGEGVAQSRYEIVLATGRRLYRPPVPEADEADS
jgi:single-strand DNA-binding protein